MAARLHPQVGFSFDESQVHFCSQGNLQRDTGRRNRGRPFGQPDHSERTFTKFVNQGVWPNFTASMEHTPNLFTQDGQQDRRGLTASLSVGLLSVQSERSVLLLVNLRVVSAFSGSTMIATTRMMAVARL